MSDVFLRFSSTLCWAESHAHPSQIMQGQPVAPKHAKWRIGSGGIRIENLRLVALERVSLGDWQLRLINRWPEFRCLLPTLVPMK